MKKAIFFLTFFFALGIATANAQCAGASATKSCCANKAAKAATSDASIEKRQAEDGTVSYVRKETDAQGNVKFVSVQFDEKTSTFVNVAPASATADSKEGMTKKAAACSASETKACAGGASSGKACCASKGAKASTATTAAPEQK
jgi:hypothetical protein